MIGRVYARGGIIYLDSDMMGERKRISTGRRADKRMLKWYERNFDSEYLALYEAKFGVKKDETPTFREYGEIIIQATHGDRTPETIKEVEAKFERLCAFFGDMPLNTIKPTDILKWQNGCGYAPKTISNYRSYINIILEAAYDDEIISRNPLRSKTAKAPKIKPVREKVFYYADDIKKLISSADGKLKNMISLFLFTGVRGGELIALKWKHIDFDNLVIRVEDNIRNGREKCTKSDTVREIPAFKPAFVALKGQQMETGLNGTYVFLNRGGKPYYNQDAIRKSFKALCKRAGVTVGSLHDLRRSCNTLLKQNGIAGDVIRDIIGHMNEEVNRKHYTGKIEVDLSVYDEFAI